MVQAALLLHTPGLVIFFIIIILLYNNKRGMDWEYRLPYKLGPTMPTLKPVQVYV